MDLYDLKSVGEFIRSISRGQYSRNWKRVTNSNSSRLVGCPKFSLDPIQVLSSSLNVPSAHIATFATQEGLQRAPRGTALPRKLRQHGNSATQTLVLSIIDDDEAARLIRGIDAGLWLRRQRCLRPWVASRSLQVSRAPASGLRYLPQDIASQVAALLEVAPRGGARCGAPRAGRVAR
jgi:hypothetical protein